jgi:hypothetical protein
MAMDAQEKCQQTWPGRVYTGLSAGALGLMASCRPVVRRDRGCIEIASLLIACRQMSGRLGPLR